VALAEPSLETRLTMRRKRKICFMVSSLNSNSSRRVPLRRMSTAGK
jgi:hypothetical protein